MAGLVLAVTVSGKVSWSDPVPPVEVSRPADAEVCGQLRPVYRRRIAVGPRGALGDVIVFLRPGAGRAQSPQTLVIDQINCQFEPRIALVPVGSTVLFRNSDALLHNVHVRDESGATVANYTMPIRGQRTPPIRLEKAGVYRVGCDAGHHWMNAWVRVFDHRAASLTDEQGRFRLQAPPGRYQIVAWHPDLGQVERDVVLTDEADVVVDFRF